jgi:hypothetical protein
MTKQEMFLELVRPALAPLAHQLAGAEEADAPRAATRTASFVASFWNEMRPIIDAIQRDEAAPCPAVPDAEPKAAPKPRKPKS